MKVIAKNLDGPAYPSMTLREVVRRYLEANPTAYKELLAKDAPSSITISGSFEITAERETLMPALAQWRLASKKTEEL